MSKFILFMSTDNAAFEENPAREIARILSEIAAKIDNADTVPDYFQTIRDVNGNDVGRYAVKPDSYKFCLNGD